MTTRKKSVELGGNCQENENSQKKTKFNFNLVWKQSGRNIKSIILESKKTHT